MSLEKRLILNRYSLLEAELRWFYYSSLYIKQERVYMFIFSRQKLLNTFFKTKLSFVLWHYLEIREKRISEEKKKKKKF